MSAGSRRIVITGMGAVTGLGLGARENWEAMVAGRSGVDYITAFDSSAFQVHIASEVRHFNPEELLDRRDVRRMDRFTQFAVYCAELAVKDDGKAVEAQPFLDEPNLFASRPSAHGLPVFGDSGRR